MADPSRPPSADRRLAALFPDEEGAPAAPWWRRRGGVAFIAGVVVALVMSGFVAADAFGSSGDDYRTATASIENVDSVQTGVATIEPVAQARVAFPVSGTVASVNVQIGQAVAAGGTLASLDTQALMQTLHTKQAALAQTQLTLSKALAGESVGGIGTGGAAGTGGGSVIGTGAATSAAYRTSAPTTRIVLTATTTNPQLAADQQAVLTAQQEVDSALAAAATALGAETSVCASFTASAPTSAGDPSPPDVTACQQAITAVADAQRAVDAAQKTLATASSTLDALLAQLASTPPTTPVPPKTTPPSSIPSGRSSGDGTGAATGAASGSSSGSGTGGAGGAGAGGSSASRSTSGGGSSSQTAADLVAYQQSVDAATAAVAVAQQAVDQAIITSPLAGTVVAVNMQVGDAVTADSSTENVVVQGPGGYEVTTTVSVDEIPSISVGQAATVAPDGSHDALPGKVVAISVAPASSSTTSTLYRVTIGLTDPNAKLDNGATGSVSIVTREARAALAVPTSAVITTGRRHVVTVMDGGTATPVAVQVGVVGNTWTEITHGISRGQQVVLADASAALPSSATASAGSTSNTGLFGGTGRPGGGGFGGGGFGGGRGGTRGG